MSLFNVHRCWIDPSTIYRWALIFFPAALIFANMLILTLFRTLSLRKDSPWSPNAETKQKFTIRQRIALMLMVALALQWGMTEWAIYSTAMYPKYVAAAMQIVVALVLLLTSIIRLCHRKRYDHDFPLPQAQFNSTKETETFADAQFLSLTRNTKSESNVQQRFATDSSFRFISAPRGNSVPEIILARSLWNNADDGDDFTRHNGSTTLWNAMATLDSTNTVELLPHPNLSSCSAFNGEIDNHDAEASHVSASINSDLRHNLDAFARGTHVETAIRSHRRFYFDASDLPQRDSVVDEE